MGSSANNLSEARSPDLLYEGWAYLPLSLCKLLQHLGEQLALINQLWAIDTNWRRLHYGQLMPNGIKTAFFPFFMHSARLLRSSSCLWLAADCHYSVMASGRTGSN